MLIIGPTGSGKSVHVNQMTALERKYNGFTYIFDIGGSYESQVELYGGKVDRVGKDGPRVNPFSLEPTESNIKFLYSFMKLLLTNGGAELTPEDEDAVFKSVQGMYHLDRQNRRLSNLILPRHLDRYMSKWVGTGVYAAVFDNVADELSLARVQCFDFQGVNNKQYADLIEPLMVWLLRRIDEVLYNPANLGVPKHVVIEELFSSMKNKQLLDAALASIKTVRKNLGGVTLIGQSANDLGENADSIVNSCTSFLFLPDATFNRKHYAELFKLTDQQLDLFESLQQREALYIRRDGMTKVVTPQPGQPQLRQVLHEAEGPGTPRQAHREVRPAGRASSALRKARPDAVAFCIALAATTHQPITHQGHPKDTYEDPDAPHSCHKPCIRCSGHRYAASPDTKPQPHQLFPSAPRTVVVADTDTAARHPGRAAPIHPDTSSR